MRNIIVFPQKVYNQKEWPGLAKEGLEIKLVGKSSHWSTKAVILESLV